MSVRPSGIERVRIREPNVLRGEPDEAARTRAGRRNYLAERGYKVCEVRAADVERNVGKVLDDLASRVF